MTLQSLRRDGTLLTMRECYWVTNAIGLRMLRPRLESGQRVIVVRCLD